MALGIEDSKREASRILVYETRQMMVPTLRYRMLEEDK